MTRTNERRGVGGVLVATDFSASANTALQRAIRLPRRPGAWIELHHVLPRAANDELAGRLDADAKHRLDEERQTVLRLLDELGDEDRKVFVSTSQGKAFTEIVRAARHGRAEVIVLGRHGERSFRDMILGSTVERVVRDGDVSVLVVSTAAEGPYRRPLVAVDMSDSSKRALELALCLRDEAVETLDVLHVVEPPNPASEPEARDEALRRAREELSEFLGRAALDGPCNVILTAGDARESILDVAKERGCDLLALGTRGRTGLPHVLLGSVAEGVLGSASCDVLVARLPSADLSLP